MNRNYSTAREMGLTTDYITEWADNRETHPAVAVAIHAIADIETRAPEKIWEKPTPAEWDNVVMAVADYVTHGDYEAEDGYSWGEETIDARDPDSPWASRATIKIGNMRGNSQTGQ